MVPSFAHTHQGAPFEPPLDPNSPDFALHCPPTAIDKRDADTPDAWVPRDERILRLTGRHPLNCEPPMDQVSGAEGRGGGGTCRCRRANVAPVGLSRAGDIKIVLLWLNLFASAVLMAPLAEARPLALLERASRGPYIGTPAAGYSFVII